MADLRRLLRQDRVVLRCDTPEAERVFVELRDGRVVVHDDNRTWFDAVASKDDLLPWDDQRVQQLAAERDVDIVREFHEEEQIGLRLERVVRDDESIADVVTTVSDLLDAVASVHSMHGGWRDED